MPDQTATTRLTREGLLAAAGYGCVLCGSPVVTFLSGGSGEIVLCPEHARLHEAGDVDPATLAASLDRPFNLEHVADSGSLRVSSRFPVARFKGIIVVNDELALVADDEPLLRLRVVEGRLLISLTLYDADDVVRADIVDNEWMYGDPQEVLIDHSTNKLVITLQGGEPILSIDANKTPLGLTASLTRNGAPILIGSKGISVGGRPAGFIDDGYAGCLIEVDTATQKVTMTPDPRHGGHSIIVTERDPFERLVKALNAMASLRSHVEDDPFSHL